MDQPTPVLGGGMAVQSAKPATPVQVAINRIGEEVENVFKQVAGLESMLTPVLSAPMPEPSNDSIGREIKGTSPYVDQLTSIESRLHNLQSTLQSVLSRIEA